MAAAKKKAPARPVKKAPARAAPLRKARRHDPDWEPPIPGKRRSLKTWDEYMTLAKRIVGRFHDRFELKHFTYMHPERLQRRTAMRFRKPYPVKMAYTDWGNPARQTVVCVGGVANTAMRFNYLANDLASNFRVVCMDWAGRGLSAWMAEEFDYSLDTYVEQLEQLILHLNTGPVILLGSSMGGSAAIELAARAPKLVSRLILNDIGPYIPKARRRRRAQTLARHYLFRNPGDLLRRIGASQKNDGPISDDIRFNVTFHQTKWSDEEEGRVYRHDVRALQAYKQDAKVSLEQWGDWGKIRCPVFVIHGMMSDALLPPTLKRMMKKKHVSVMHVPDTGHTPVLSDRNQNWFIREWLLGDATANEWSVLYAKLRDEETIQEGARLAELRGERITA